MHLKKLRPFIICICVVQFVISCKKVDHELDIIRNQPGVYRMSPVSAFKGDTIEISGLFNNDPGIRFLFGNREAQIVGKTTQQARKEGLLYGEPEGTIEVEAYKIIVPEDITGSVLVTAVFGRHILPVADFSVRQPPPLIAGNVSVTTFAGNTDASLQIIDGELLNASFGLIESMIVLPDGTIYTADFDPVAYSAYIRKVADGKVTTIAGGGSQLEGAGRDVHFHEIKGLAADANGDIYIAERTFDPVYFSSYSRIVKMDKNTHEVSLFAGRIFDAFDTTPLNDSIRLFATFYDIGDITFDATGNLYVADFGNNTIRVIAPDGMVSSPVAMMDCNVVDGISYCNVLSGYEDGFGKEVRLTGPMQISAAANGRIYFSEAATLREFNPTSNEVTIIGGFPDQFVSKYGPLNNTVFAGLRSVAPDAQGNILVADGNYILKVDLSERYVYILAGNGIQGFQDGPGESAAFNLPTEVGFDAKGNFYVADRGNGRIRKITVQ